MEQTEYKCWRGWKEGETLIHLQTGAAIVEITVEDSQKAQNKSIV